MAIQKITVLGSGTMGAGIAQTAATAGFDTIVHDIDAGAIAKAILPFLAVEILVIFLITYVPQISMTVPYLTDFIRCPPDTGYMACISPGSR